MGKSSVEVQANLLTLQVEKITCKLTAPQRFFLLTFDGDLRVGDSALCPRKKFRIAAACRDKGIIAQMPDHIATDVKCFDVSFSPVGLAVLVNVLSINDLHSKASRGRPRKPIDQAIVDCFGTMKDQDVATKFGRALKWVRKTRQNLGIDAYAGDQLLPQLEQNAEVLEMLGKASDRSLAKQYGGSHWVYRTLREERGILPYGHERRAAEAELWEKNRDAATALLGKVSDNELGRRFGGLQCRYSYLRHKAGIPVSPRTR
ncbi:hypothetical protein [Pseudomonas sp. MWU12-2323]|uniref:hypothetical protein n=1 Tax=Pseudomonas sp. MWU12-2323 TaxID=2651296 RepID=UPI00128DF9C0|nr:hypothetical protein [Pseudomonas sp. MWU12-2323]MPQ69360.1 hypothetical protein [Pseudomonas sp. MWU12-2323]